MNLPSISVLQARSTYFIGALVGLLVLSGYIPESEAQDTEDLFLGLANQSWAALMEIAAVVSGVLAWLERRNPSKSLSLTGAGAANSHWVVAILAGVLFLLPGCEPDRSKAYKAGLTAAIEAALPYAEVGTATGNALGFDPVKIPPERLAVLRAACMSMVAVDTEISETEQRVCDAAIAAGGAARASGTVQ